MEDDFNLARRLIHEKRIVPGNLHSRLHLLPFRRVYPTFVRVARPQGASCFFRNSACALCNLRIRHFIRRYEEWRSQGMEVVAVFESREASLSLHVGR